MNKMILNPCMMYLFKVEEEVLTDSFFITYAAVRKKVNGGVNIFWKNIEINYVFVDP